MKNNQVKILLHLICILCISSLPAFGQTESNIEKIIKNLEDGLNTLNPDSTLLSIDELLQSDRMFDSITLARLHFLKGKSYDKQDQLKKSYENLEVAYSYLSPPDTNSHLAGSILNLMGYILHDQRDASGSIQKLFKSLEIRKKYNSQYPNELAKTYYNIARSYTSRVYTNADVVVYADSAIVLFEKLENPTSELMRAHMIKGVAQEEMYELKSAFTSYNKAKALSDKFPEDEKAMINLYLNIGNYYQKIDDDVTAELNYNTALNLSLKVNGKNHFKTNSIRENLATVKGTLRKFDEALKISKEVLMSNIALYGELDVDVGFGYNNLGNIYSKMKDDETALHYFKKAEKIYQIALDPLSIDLATNHLHLGESYSRIEKYDQALESYDKTLAIVEQVLGPDHIINAACHYYKAVVYSDMGRFDEAMAAYDITKNKLGYRDDDWSELKSKSKAADLHFNIGISFTKWYDATGNKENLNKAKTNFDTALDLMWTARGDYESKESGDFLMRKYRVSFQHTLINLMKLNANSNDQLANEMFTLIDAIKSNQLKDAILAKKSITFENIPEELKKLESSLNANIYNLEGKLSALKKDARDSIKRIAQLESKIANTKNEHNECLTKIATNHTSYYNLKYDQQYASIQNVQEGLLQENELLINYFIDRDYLVVIGIHKNGYALDTLNVQQDFNATLDSYLTSLKSGNQDSITEQSQYLYSVLLGNIIKNIDAPLEGLILIPEGKLSYLPFESLMIDKETFVNEKYHVRYGYSAKILLQQSDEVGEGNNRILAIAPEYEDTEINKNDELIALLVRSGEYALPGSLREVNNIKNILPTTLLSNQNATESQFKEKAPLHQILHLSMHALVDKNYPLESRLVFSPEEEEDGMLHAYELYSMDLNAKLAVLSACSTGEGQMKIGEGVQSLNRAFTYAGVKSTVMSLWKVPDASTELIMSAFYKNLKNGLTKSKALQKAKQEYLQNEIIPKRKHPYYWAGFILAGNDDSIQFSTAFNILYLLIPVCIFLIFFFFKKKYG